LVAIRAGEAGGGQALPRVLRNVAIDLRTEATARSAFSAAIFYPFAVWLVCMPMAVFVAVFILPKFQDILKCMGIAWWKSGATVALFGMRFSFVLVLVPLVAAILSMPQPRNAVAEYVWRWTHAAWAGFQNALPLLRARARQRCLARCARAIAAMVDCGVTFHEACRRVAEPELAGQYAGAFRCLAGATEKGRPLADALKEAGLPESFSALLLAGAAGGQLPLALSSAAEWYDARVQRINRIMAVAFPCVMIPLMGAIVGLIYVGLFHTILVTRHVIQP
jgi:type II secretory pathway component PulF